MRKYNYTGRKRINKEDFVLSMHSVSESNNTYFEFEIEESITSLFNPASSLVLEAYHRSTFMRFDWGKVNNLKPAKDRYLNAFTDTELIQFRTKIISELGMIEAFQALQDSGAQADPSALAGGIWEALLTTAAGMGIAIPASILLSWYDGVVSNVQADIENLATQAILRTS